MRQLTLTNEQFDALHNHLEDICNDINDNIDHEDISLSDYVLYHIWQQLDKIKSDPKVTNSDKVYPEVDDVPDNIKKDWLYNKDDNYSDKVDTLVGNMVASNDNEFTHDSEGC